MPDPREADSLPPAEVGLKDDPEGLTDDPDGPDGMPLRHPETTGRLRDSLLPAEVRLMDDPDGLGLDESPLLHPDTIGRLRDSLLPAEVKLEPDPLDDTPLLHPEAADELGGLPDSLEPDDEGLLELPPEETEPPLQPDRDDGLLGLDADSLLPADGKLDPDPLTELLQPDPTGELDGLLLGEDDGLLGDGDGGETLDSLLPDDDCGDDDDESLSGNCLEM